MAAPVSQSPAQGIYRSIVNSQYHLYEGLDVRFQVISKKIMEIAVDVTGEWVDGMQKSGQEIKPEQALDEIARQLSQYKIAYDDIARVADLQNKVVLLGRQNKTLQAENERLKGGQGQDRQEPEARQGAQGREKRDEDKPARPQQSRKPEKQPPPAQQMPRPAQPPEARDNAKPDWYTSWEEASIRANRFVWDSTILRVIGETGMSERQAIVNEAVQRQGVSEQNKRPIDALTRLVDDGFLTVRDADTNPTGGRPPKLYQLTDKGKAAYIFLTNSRPQASEMENKTIHKSDGHTLLNGRTARILEAAGYRILAQGERIELAGGHLFQPDITAVHPATGEVIYVEVETEASKNDRIAREQKWQNCCNATEGNIYLVAANRKSEMKILSEIRSALPRRRFRIRSFNYEDGPAPDGIVWSKG